MSECEFRMIDRKVAYIHLTYAIENEDLEALKTLISNTFNTKLWLYSILNMACDDGKDKVVEFLLRSGLDIDYDEDRYLIKAAENGHIDVLKALCYDYDRDQYNSSEEMVKFILKEYNREVYNLEYKSESQIIKKN